MLYALARPLLFALDPERAHELTLGLADAPGQGGPPRDKGREVGDGVGARLEEGDRLGWRVDAAGGDEPGAGRQRLA